MTDTDKLPPKPDGEVPDPSRINYAREAFKWQYNVIALANVAAFSILSTSKLPLILTTNIKLIYLNLVPQNNQFHKLMRS